MYVEIEVAVKYPGDKEFRHQKQLVCKDKILRAGNTNEDKYNFIEIQGTPPILTPLTLDELRKILL